MPGPYTSACFVGRNRGAAGDFGRLIEREEAGELDGVAVTRRVENEVLERLEVPADLVGHIRPGSDKPDHVGDRVFEVHVREPGRLVGHTGVCKSLLEAVVA